MTYLAVHSKKGKREVEAASAYAAQLKAAQEWGIKKSFEVSVTPVAKDGNPIPIDTTTL